MHNTLLICFLISCIFILFIALGFLCFYQRKQKNTIQQISDKLSNVLDKDTDEKIMVFTDNKIQIDLITQINRLLENKQLMSSECKKSEMTSKRMLSNISHDIKTPLTVILGYLEMILLNRKDDTIMLKKVEDKAKQVMELINKFFTLAKIEAGDMDIAIARININELFKENVLDFYNILTEKEFEVDVNFPETDLFVYGNTDALNRIFFNLISNAIRYGNDGKYLGAALRFDDIYVWIDIIDHGKGIEKSMEAYVFDRLYTKDDSRNAKYGGSGLGLAISKSLVEKLDGDIMLMSEPGVKTVFTVKLRRINY